MSEEAGNEDLYGMVTGITQEKVSPYREEEGKTADESHELGIKCLEDGDFKGAANQLRKAMDQTDVPGVELVFDYAAALEACDELEQACLFYEQAHAMSPAPTSAAAIGVIKKRLGYTKEGLEWLEQAIQLDPDDAQMHLAFADVLRETGRKKLAASHGAIALTLTEADEELILWVCALHLEARLDAEALEYAQTALNRRPEAAEAHQLKSIALWKTGDKPGAIRSLEVAMEFEDHSGLNREILAIFQGLGVAKSAMIEREMAHDLLKRFRVDLG